MTDSENQLGEETRDAELGDESKKRLTEQFLGRAWLGGFLKGLSIRVLFLLLAIATFSGLTDSVGQKLTKPAWESSYASLQTSLVHSGIWMGSLTVIEGGLIAVETATVEPEIVGNKVGKVEPLKFFQPVTDILKDLNHYLTIITILLVVQLSILKLIQLYSLKILVGFGAAACAIQYRRGTLFGNVGQLFIVFGIITYFVYPMALHFGINRYHEHKIQAATEFSENIGTLKEEISDVEIFSTNFKENLQLVKEITVGGIAATWNGFMSWLYGEMLICIFIPILTLAFIGFIIHQALIYMDMSAMAGVLVGSAGKVVSSLGSNTRGRLSRSRKTEGAQTPPKGQVERVPKIQNNPKTFTSIFIMLIVIPFLSACTQGKNLNGVDSAANLMKSGDPKGAISLLRPIVQEEPDNYKAHFTLGEAFQTLSSSAKDIRNLYLARYYFDRAKQLATNDTERSEAEDAYVEVKINMGKLTQSADSILKVAEREEKLGKKNRAAPLFIRAGDLYLIEKDYKKALNAYRKSLALNDSQELEIKLATTQFFNLEPDKCLDTLKTVAAANTSPPVTQFLDAFFLESAATILNVQAERKFANFLSKKLSEEKRQIIEKCLADLCDSKYIEPSGQEKEKAILLARAWELLAAHVSDVGMSTCAQSAYEAARSFYLFTGSEKEALQVGEKLAKIHSS